MCLVVLNVRPNEDLHYVVAANRDELHDRPTLAAHPWSDSPEIHGGRDLVAGGTWLAVRGSRLAAITNVRSPEARRHGRSRGALPARFLREETSAAVFAENLSADVAYYPAFNLVLADGDRVHYLNEQTGSLVELSQGVHGLSNARMDVAWPKVERVEDAMGRAVSGSQVDVDMLLTALSDRTGAPDEALPSTGVPIELERVLASPFISGPTYGTRASTVVVCRRDGTLFVERSFGPNGLLLTEKRFSA